ncbi:hypothetical protein LAV44_14955 [Clostridium sporogenes]|uniref:ABC-three component system middle component 6 n=1 Tax=Clostridium sporogenes TaxID=1509 RepID=UPI002237B71B|nr:ABC-three component system middle component 6 [Clostridium sporogenes]MCW6076605.1 hypothetical protein [Clostridium sporogenes]
MDYFLMSRYQSIEENIMYVSMKLYKLLDKQELHIDQLFEQYSINEDIQLNMVLEKVLYLSLTFLYSIGKITVKYNMVKRS